MKPPDTHTLVALPPEPRGEGWEGKSKEGGRRGGGGERGRRKRDWDFGRRVGREEKG